MAARLTRAVTGSSLRLKGGTNATRLGDRLLSSGRRRGTRRTRCRLGPIAVCPSARGVRDRAPAQVVAAAVVVTCDVGAARARRADVVAGCRVAANTSWLPLGDQCGGWQPRVAGSARRP